MMGTPGHRSLASSIHYIQWLAGNLAFQSAEITDLVLHVLQ